MVKTKTFRITLRDWKILRNVVEGNRRETISQYMERVIDTLKNYKGGMEENGRKSNGETVEFCEQPGDSVTGVI